MCKLGARYYDASTGRFTQMDPIGQEANPYLYAGGNPCNNVDPTGTYSKVGCGISIAGTGVAFIFLAGAMLTRSVGAAYLTMVGYSLSVGGSLYSCFDDLFKY